MCCSLVPSSFSALLSLNTEFLYIGTSLVNSLVNLGEDGIPLLIPPGIEDARMLLEREVFLLGKLSGVRVRCLGELTGDVEIISDNLEGEEVLGVAIGESLRSASGCCLDRFDNPSLSLLILSQTF